MDPYQKRVGELFMAAAGLPEDRRGAFLGSLPAGDGAVVAEVRVLLEADRRNGDGFLLGAQGLPPEEPVLPRPVELDRAEPARMGPFRLVSILGEGEHAIVYLAEQAGPVARRVALKFLRRRGSTADALRRFEEERRIIAQMDHPNIARLYQTGIAPDGRTYLAMEYVPGEPITAFAEAAGLSVRGRLGLFVQACLGVEHAHQRGIIHRDIKPRNILAATGADGRAVVKVIDFGIAKAIGADHVRGETLTRDGQFMGTPAYMSPEQVRGDSARIDTRSDVYAMGAVLYELLTGVPVIDTSTAGPLTIVAGILEAEPRRPELIDPALAGDPATIICACIAKDPARRYQSVAELRGDIERFLGGLPIKARPPSAVYVTGKFIRRHRARIIAAAVVVAAGAVVAGNAWRVQQRRFDLAIEMAQSWFDRTRDIARSVGDRARRGPDLELLLSHISGLLARSPDHPGLLGLQGDVLGAIGDLEQEQGRMEAAAGTWGRVLEIRRGLARGSPARADLRMDLSIAQVRVGDLANELGDRGAAVGWYRLAMDLDERTLAENPDSARAVTLMSWSCHRLGSMAHEAGDAETALALHTRELGLAERLQGMEETADSRRALSSVHLRLGALARDRGEGELAGEHFSKAAVAARAAAVLGPDDRLAQVHLVGVVSDELRAGLESWTPEEAMVHAMEAARLTRDLAERNPDDPLVNQILVNGLVLAGRCAERAGDAEMAQRLQRRALDQGRRYLARSPEDSDRRAMVEGLEADAAAALPASVPIPVR